MSNWRLTPEPSCSGERYTKGNYQLLKYSYLNEWGIWFIGARREKKTAIAIINLLLTKTKAFEWADKAIEEYFAKQLGGN